MTLMSMELTSIHQALIGTVGLLAVAHALVFVLRRVLATDLYEELQRRTKTWWVMVVIATLALVINQTVTIVAFGCLSFLALKEFLTITPTRRADRRMLLWAYLTIPAQYYWVATSWYGMFSIFIPVWVFLFMPARMLLHGETKNFLKACTLLNWGLMTTVYSLSHAAYLVVLGAEKSGQWSDGAALLFCLVFLTQINDVAQFTTGKLFKGPKVVPKVSPGKTWSGLLGGIVITIGLASLLLPWLTPITRPYAAVLGGLLSVGGFFGDVVISAIKRDLEIKDTGTLLPGHGGILDRVDSLTYTAPIFLHFVRYYFY